MKERPVLFSAPMVLALLAGTKTQTRRILKNTGTDAPVKEPWEDWGAGTFGSCATDGTSAIIHCPYGQPGDRLWVREAWGYRGGGWSNKTPTVRDVDIEYRADSTKRRFIRGADDGAGIPKQHLPSKFDGVRRLSECETDEQADLSIEYGDWMTRWWRQWRPSIHMPRWASRITLEVTGVRVERLNDISEEDAKDEGAKPVVYDPGGDCWTATEAARLTPHKVGFEYLWWSISGPGSWAVNPWVWTISLRRLP